MGGVKRGRCAGFGRELDALVKLSEKNDTFMELYRPEDGKPDGSPRQLWSASGFLSMVYHGLFGMDFEAAGVRFAPVVPAAIPGVDALEREVPRRQVDIVVKGAGTRVHQFKLDGKTQRKPFFHASTRARMRLRSDALTASEHPRLSPQLRHL